MNSKPASLFVVIAVLFWSGSVEGAPIPVRLAEGNFRGFLVLRSLDGTAIAYGEMSQKPTGKFVDSHMILNYHESRDGQLLEEGITEAG